MAPELLALIIGISLIAVLICVSVLLIIKDQKNNKTKKLTKEEIYALEEERLNDEGEITTMHVEVIGMACGAKAANSYLYKYPDVKEFFIITFKKDNKDVLEIPVAKEMYDGFDVGLQGMLTLVDGGVLSFVPDSE